jgi:hypothetical protein
MDLTIPSLTEVAPNSNQKTFIRCHPTMSSIVAKCLEFIGYVDCPGGESD